MVKERGQESRPGLRKIRGALKVLWDESSAGPPYSSTLLGKLAMSFGEDSGRAQPTYRPQNDPSEAPPLLLPFLFLSSSVWPPLSFSSPFPPPQFGGWTALNLENGQRQQERMLTVRVARVRLLTKPASALRCGCAVASTGPCAGGIQE